MLHILYKFAAICCSSIRVNVSKKLNILIKNADSVLGTALELLKLIVKRRLLHN